MEGGDKIFGDQALTGMLNESERTHSEVEGIKWTQQIMCCKLHCGSGANDCYANDSSVCERQTYRLVLDVELKILFLADGFANHLVVTYHSAPEHRAKWGVLIGLGNIRSESIASRYRTTRKACEFVDRFSRCFAREVHLLYGNGHRDSNLRELSGIH